MDTSERLLPGFVQRRLPWIVTASALVLYLVTLSHWVRLNSLPLVARVAGWDWTPTLEAPLYFVITYPVRWMPGPAQPVLLNILAAVFGALSLGLLARSVALLPFDRTREARQRERGEHGLLGIPLAWVGPVFAVLLCGLQLTFWEHATAATGETLDLLLFAWLVRALLEYRVSRNERWLTGLALVYGLAVTNNHAMIAFFPCFLFALVWIKGFEFFNLAFIGRMTGWGLAGLLPYLILPAVAVATSASGEAGFAAYLRTVLANQKAALLSVPPFIVLLLAGTSVLPVLLMGVRWPAAEGDTSRAGVLMAAFITRFMHVVMLVASVSVFLDPIWGPRSLGAPLAYLPLYYLAALAVGYYAGYLLLMARPPAGRAHFRVSPGMRLAGQALAGATLAAAVAVPGWLIYRNLPVVRVSNSRILSDLADRLVEGLPAKGAYVISDHSTDLLLLQVGLAKRGLSDAHVLVSSRLMPFKQYHQELARRVGARWPFASRPDVPESIEPARLALWLRELAASNQCYYLHPSAGYYFETVRLQPAGMLFRLTPWSADALAGPLVGPDQVEAGEKYWEALRPQLEAVPPLESDAPIERRYVSAVLARNLGTWGFALQRSGHADKARRWLDLAVRLNPGNTSARMTRVLNDQLRAGAVAPLDAALDPIIDAERRGWDRLLLDDGPFDHPQMCFRMALVYVEGGLYRQALTELRRVRALLPQDAVAQLWESTMEVMADFTLGRVAEAEARALELRARHPREDNVLEALTQIYLGTGRMTNALSTIDEQLALDPGNARALLNKAAVCIHMKDFKGAIVPLNTLLKAQPENSPALLNRAIAHLQAGQLDAAEQDYEALRRLLPQYHAVYYGLGEVAFRRQDKANALKHYEQYLRYGDQASDEYKAVAERVRQLKAGGA